MVGQVTFDLTIYAYVKLNCLALTDDIRLPFWLGEKRKLRAARGSGITATSLALVHNFTQQVVMPCLTLRPKCVISNAPLHSGAFCLRQNAQRAALRAAGQATSGKLCLRNPVARAACVRIQNFEPRALLRSPRPNSRCLRKQRARLPLCGPAATLWPHGHSIVMQPRALRKLYMILQCSLAT